MAISPAMNFATFRGEPRITPASILRSYVSPGGPTVDSCGQTVDFYLSETRDRQAAKLFLEKALANPDDRPPRVLARDGLRSYAAAIRELQFDRRIVRRCRQRTRRYCNNRIESDHRQVKRRLRAMQGPRTAVTAWAVIQGIEAAHIIRKGQVLGITRQNLHGQAWVFRALLGVA
jgi:transposase, IS6 family